MQSPSWAPGMCGAGRPPAGSTAPASPCTSTPTLAIACPTGASDQLYAFTRVSTAERLAGDLVFFSYGGGDISHVGIYLGGGAFIHATSNGGVKISYFDSYYSSTYVGAVRVLAD